MTDCTWIKKQLEELPLDRKRKMPAADGSEFEIGSVSADPWLGLKYVYLDGLNCFEFYVRPLEDEQRMYPMKVSAANPPMRWSNPLKKTFEQNIDLFFGSNDPLFPGTDTESAKSEIAKFCGPAFAEFSWSTPVY